MLYRQIYEHRAPMMRFLTSLHIPLPKAFQAAAEFVLNGYLRRALVQEDIDTERVKTLFETAKFEGVPLDNATLEFSYRHNLEQMTARLLVEPTESGLQQLDSGASLLPYLPFSVDLWKIQNAYYGLLKNAYPNMRDSQERGDPVAQSWVRHFEALGQKLSIRVNKGIGG